MWNGRALILFQSRALQLNDDINRYSRSEMVRSVQSPEKNSFKNNVNSMPDS